MRRGWLWFWLSLKRCLYRPAFLGILFLLPLGTFFIHSQERQSPAEIRIAVFAEGQEAGSGREIPSGQEAGSGREAPLGQEVGSGREIFSGQAAGAGREAPLGQEVGSGREISSGQAAGAGREIPLEQELRDALVIRETGDSIFRFYECGSEEQLKDEVASRRAECGYVFGKGLRDRLNRKDFKRCIRVYSAPSTVTAKLSSETVFAAMIELYDRELFRNYAFGAWETDEKLSGGIYDQWKENGSTFRFVYEIVDGKELAEKAFPDQSLPVFPVRGIVAVYVFVIGLYGAVISLEDEKRGLFLSVPYGRRSLCRLAAMTAPVALAAVSGLAALWTGKCQQGAVKEISVMAGYVAAVVLFSWAIRLLGRRQGIVCCLIPFFLIGSLIFCPVFFDVGRYLPEFGMWGKFFLPGYYLRFFS